MQDEFCRTLILSAPKREGIGEAHVQARNITNDASKFNEGINILQGLINKVVREGHKITLAIS